MIGVILCENKLKLVIVCRKMIPKQFFKCNNITVSSHFMNIIIEHITDIRHYLIIIFFLFEGRFSLHFLNLFSFLNHHSPVDVCLVVMSTTTHQDHFNILMQAAGIITDDVGFALIMEFSLTILV